MTLVVVHHDEETVDGDVGDRSVVRTVDDVVVREKETWDVCIEKENQREQDRVVRRCFLGHIQTSCFENLVRTSGES